MCNAKKWLLLQNPATKHYYKGISTKIEAGKSKQFFEDTPFVGEAALFDALKAIAFLRNNPYYVILSYEMLKTNV